MRPTVVGLPSLPKRAVAATQAESFQKIGDPIKDLKDRADRVYLNLAQRIALTTLRRAEQQQMADYARLPFGQHMAFLVQALDGDVSAVRPPTLAALPTTVNEALVRDAVAFLRRTSLPIEPRKKWPDYGLPQFQVKGNIALQHQAQPGKALCVWGDAGWGGLVRQSKYQQRHFADDLVTACASMVHQWQPQPAPTWVTCVPSLRHPDLVPDFARRLATALGLPFHIVLAKTDHRPEQKTMANSAQQARNVDGSLALCVNRLPHRGPVLLVDDMVDSRWTLTVCAWMLRCNRSGEVWPLALSLAGQDEDPT